MELRALHNGFYFILNSEVAFCASRMEPSVNDVIDVATQADMDGIAYGVQTDILLHLRCLDLFNSQGLDSYSMTSHCYSTRY